jgi:hypothetical protein
MKRPLLLDRVTALHAVTEILDRHSKYEPSEMEP